jgi:intracellular multiplication protein IcmD
MNLIRIFLLCFFPIFACAENLSLGDLAANVTHSFEAITKLITAGAYVGGITFFVVAIFQFKQYKENPTQVPLSKPMMILFMSSALIFLPEFVNSVNTTIFGPNIAVARPEGFLPGVY